MAASDPSRPELTGEDWTGEELALIVADYFAMLHEELCGRPYNKTAHRRALLPRLRGRSDASVEFKHRNISEVLLRRGLLYIDGYKPASNIQAALSREVDAYLDAHCDFFLLLEKSPRVDPDELPRQLPALGVIFVPPPDKIVVPDAADAPWFTRKGRHIDFVRRDAENRRLAELGEKLVVDLERRRLASAGRDDLARKVQWASHDFGDGLGFDVLSFDAQTDGERFVEVKTTGQGKYFPFYVTANEVRCSEAVAGQYHLYRLFNVGTDPRVYTLPGAISRNCALDPVQFRARIEAK